MPLTSPHKNSTMLFKRNVPKVVEAPKSAGVPAPLSFSLSDCILGGPCSRIIRLPPQLLPVPAVVGRACSGATSSAESVFNAALVVLLGGVGLYKAYQGVQQRARVRKRANEQEKINSSITTKSKPPSVKSFQLRFLPVFWLLRLSFWMAGPYFYPAYASKIINGSSPSALLISRIFLAGFGAIVLFAPLTGTMLDRYGRKRGTLAAVVLYGLGALSTKSSNLWVLFVGRAVGGVGTNLLSSAPESWLVSEATRTGSDDSDGTYLRETFGLAYGFDPVVAIVAGQLAGWCAGWFGGPTGPFAVMPIFLALAGTIALVCWEENKADALRKVDDGAQKPQKEKKDESGAIKRVKSAPVLSHAAEEAEETNAPIERTISAPGLEAVGSDEDSGDSDGNTMDPKPDPGRNSMRNNMIRSRSIEDMERLDYDDGNKPRRNNMLENILVRSKSLEDVYTSEPAIRTSMKKANGVNSRGLNVTGLNYDMTAMDGGGGSGGGNGPLTPNNSTDRRASFSISKSVARNLGVMKKVFNSPGMDKMRRSSLDHGNSGNAYAAGLDHSIHTVDSHGLSQFRRDSLCSVGSVDSVLKKALAIFRTQGLGAYRRDSLEHVSVGSEPGLPNNACKRDDDESAVSGSRRRSSSVVTFSIGDDDLASDDSIFDESLGGELNNNDDVVNNPKEKTEEEDEGEMRQDRCKRRSNLCGLQLAKSVKMPSLNKLDIDGMDETPTIRDGLKMIGIDRKLLMLGAVQSLFEGSMYIFVMQWPPAMTAAVRKYFGEDEPVPFGTVFSCFMACCMVGSTLFRKLASQKGARMESLFLYMLIASVASMAGTTYGIYAGFKLFPLVLSMFAFEGCVGMYFPLIGSMRGKYLHASHRSVIMTLFSVPLNVLVVTVCLLIHRLGMIGAFGVTTVALAVASACMARLVAIRRSEAKRHWGEIRRTLRRMSLVKLFMEATKRKTDESTKSLRCSETSVRDSLKDSVTMGNQVA